MRKLSYVFYLVLAVVFTSCDTLTEWKSKIDTKLEYKEYKTTNVIKKKHLEYESINNFGAFRTEYYFMYENGDVENVTRNSYIKFEVGETVVTTHYYR